LQSPEDAFNKNENSKDNSVKAIEKILNKTSKHFCIVG
jgi:hypothetical protein